MDKRIIISGKGPDEADLRLLRPAEYDFVSLPGPDLMTEGDIARLHNEARDASLTIISGGSPRCLERLRLESIKTPKAYWSLDSHRQCRRERNFQHLFEAVFLTHSPHLKFFDPGKTNWLPCPVLRFGTAEALEFLKAGPSAEGQNLDVFFTYRPGGPGSSEHLAGYLKTLLAGRKCFFGEPESASSYARALQSAKVVLNIPHFDELNAGHFEAWLFNRILLTCPGPDMARVARLPEGTVFFKPDGRDFLARLEQALDLANRPCHTAPLVLNGHLLIHRYAELINKVLGGRLTVKEIQADTVEIPRADHSPVPPLVVEGRAPGLALTVLAHKDIAGALGFSPALRMEGDIAVYHKQFISPERVAEEFKEFLQALGPEGSPFERGFIILHNGRPYPLDGRLRAAVRRYLFPVPKSERFIAGLKKTAALGEFFMKQGFRGVSTRAWRAIYGLAIKGLPEPLKERLKATSLGLKLRDYLRGKILS